MSGAGSSAVEVEIILLFVEVVITADNKVGVVGIVVPVKAVRGLAVDDVVGAVARGSGSGALGVDIDAVAVDDADIVVVLLRGLLSRLSALLGVLVRVLLSDSGDGGLRGIGVRLHREGFDREYGSGDDRDHREG